jgi:hypothetical protein
MKTFVVLATTALLLAGCQSGNKTGDKAAPGMINSGCPFSGEAVGEGAPTAAWNGRTVGFCCNGCVKRWNGWSDEQKDGYVRAQK